MTEVVNIMKGEFIILLDGEMVTYTEYDEIPLVFDNVIKYSPYYPYHEDGSDHTEEEHKYIDTLNDGLLELMKRETK